jgi:hypothetical protein
MPGTAIKTDDKIPGATISGNFTLDLASVAADTQATDTVAIDFARVGDVVVCTPRGALTAGLELKHAYVSANGTVTLVFYNHTAGAIDESSTVFDYVVIRGSNARLW